MLIQMLCDVTVETMTVLMVIKIVKEVTVVVIEVVLARASVSVGI